MQVRDLVKKAGRLVLWGVAGVILSVFAVLAFAIWGRAEPGVGEGGEP